MKASIYISGIAGVILIVLRLIGIYTESSYNDVILIMGLILLGIFIILIIVDKSFHNRRINNIIQSHERKKADIRPVNKDESKASGWSMNDSPFRERKSGLTWAG